MKILRGTITLIARITDVLLILLIGGLVAVIFTELLYRNILNRSFRSAVEISGIMFIWMIFLGIVHLYDRDKMLRFEILLSRVKGWAAEILWYINKVVCLCLGIVMVIAFIRLYPFISTRFYVTMRFLPFTMHYLPMAIAGGFLVLKSVEELLTKIFRLTREISSRTTVREGES
jgi:TRAP-type C4-dicarboxylate transport system permease small subunit